MEWVVSLENVYKGDIESKSKDVLMKALKEFQKEYKLTTGEVTIETLEALNVNYSPK